MGRVRRPRMSAREKVELWKRWKRGESLSDIGRALGRIPGAVHHVVAARGGIPPPSRTRSRRSLTLTEREELSRGLARGYSVRQIGVRLSRAPSTISREVRRNGGRRQYRASVADARGWDRARRPNPCRLALSPLLRALVAEKLAADWSPQQIAGWLKQTFPQDPCLHVSPAPQGFLGHLIAREYSQEECRDGEARSGFGGGGGSPEGDRSGRRARPWGTVFGPAQARDGAASCCVERISSPCRGS